MQIISTQIIHTLPHMHRYARAPWNREKECVEYFQTIQNKKQNELNAKLMGARAYVHMCVESTEFVSKFVQWRIDSSSVSMRFSLFFLIVCLLACLFMSFYIYHHTSHLKKLRKFSTLSTVFGGICRRSWFNRLTKFKSHLLLVDFSRLPSLILSSFFFSSHMHLY